MVIQTSNSPELLQEQVASLLVEPLEAESIVLGSGVQIFDTAEPLRIPKLTGSSDPEWVGESELIPDHDVDFDEVKLMPTDRKSIKSLIRFSNEMLRQSVIGLDAVLKMLVVDDVARKLDTAFLTGDGTAGSVTGIINQADVQKGELDAGDPDSLLDALAMAAAAEVNQHSGLSPVPTSSASVSSRTTTGSTFSKPT